MTENLKKNAPARREPKKEFPAELARRWSTKEVLKNLEALEKKYVSLMEVEITKQATDYRDYEQKQLELKQARETLREVRGLVKAIRDFGGMQNMLRLATEGLKLEQPDIFKP